MADLVDRIVIDMQVRLAASYAFDWLKKIENSSSSLTAAFHTSAYSGSLTSTIKELEKDLRLNPENPRSGASIAKRLLDIKETTKTLSLSPDERWDYIMPALKKISETHEAESRNPLRAARALRNAVRQASCAK